MRLHDEKMCWLERLCIRFGLDVLDYGELSVPSENFLKCKQVSGIS